MRSGVVLWLFTCALGACSGAESSPSPSRSPIESSAQALTTVADGPAYPAPGGNTFASTSSSGGAIGRAGGVTWTFGGFQTTSYAQLVWGPHDDHAIQYTFDGVADAPGETLSFDAAGSDLAGGRARWTGLADVHLADGSSRSLPTRFTLTFTTSGAPVLLRATALPAPGTFDAVLPAAEGDAGAVLLVPPDGFRANLLFEAFQDGAWTPATELYDSLPTINGAPGTTSSFAGGFFSTTLPPAISVTPTSLAFAPLPVGASGAPQPVTITSAGPVGSFLHVTAVATDGADFVATSSCPASLAAGATCTVGVTFAPRGGGDRRANLLITSDAPSAGSTATVALDGTGLVPDLRFSPAQVDFGDRLVGSTASLPLQISNPGGAPLNVTGAVLSPPSPDFGLQPGTCTGPIQPGQSCVAQITFQPTSAGAQSLALVLSDDAPGSPHTVPVSGRGTLAAATLAPDTVSFGAVNLGSSATRTLVLSSTGSAPVTVNGASVGGTFAIIGGSCPTAFPFALPPGATCGIDVSFRPSAADAQAAVLHVDTSARLLSSSLSGSGLAAANLAVAISGPATAKVSSRVTYVITTSNTGPTAASAVLVNDALPPSTTFVTVGGGGFTCTAPPVGATGTVSCSAPTLAVGASAVVTLVVLVENGGKTTLLDTVTVSAATPDANLANNSASVATTVKGKP